MIKTLTKHGNSLALVIEKPILELLHIDQTTGLNISTDGTSLVIFPVMTIKRLSFSLLLICHMHAMQINPSKMEEK